MLDDYFSMFKVPQVHVYEFERNGVTFKLRIDFKRLFESIDHLKNDYYPNDDDDTMTDYVTVGTENYVSVAEYQAEIDQMMKDLIELRDDPALIEKLCDDLPKKKNGTFAKNRVTLYKEYRKTGYYVEDSYGWRYKAIRVKSFSDTEAEVYINTEIEHY